MNMNMGYVMHSSRWKKYTQKVYTYIHVFMKTSSGAKRHREYTHLSNNLYACLTATFYVLSMISTTQTSQDIFP